MAAMTRRSVDDLINSTYTMTGISIVMLIMSVYWGVRYSIRISCLNNTTPAYINTHIAIHIHIYACDYRVYARIICEVNVMYKYTGISSFKAYAMDNYCA